jgi:hypothetical protein
LQCKVTKPTRKGVAPPTPGPKLKRQKPDKFTKPEIFQP